MDHQVGADGDGHDGYALGQADALLEEDQRQEDGEDGAGLVDGHHLVHLAQLEGFEIAQPGRTGSQAGEEEETPGLAADGGEIVVSAGDQHHEPGEHQHHNGAQGCGCVGIGLFDAAFG